MKENTKQRIFAIALIVTVLGGSWLIVNDISNALSKDVEIKNERKH